jgi:tRNA A-37 threonylcarbamoyl transferase component Bud32
LVTLTEEGRIIGFVMALIVGCRHVTLEDLDICQTALARLHRLGIKHGDVNKHNFLVHQGTVTLIDFDTASEATSPGELDDELHHLQESLSDYSGRGGRCREYE